MNRQHKRAQAPRQKNHTTAQQWYEAGQMHLRNKDPKQAFVCFKHACEQNKRTAQYYEAFGKSALRLGQYKHAFDAFYHLHKITPVQDSKYTSLLSQACGGLKVDKFDKQVKEALLLCLQSDDIDHQRLAPLWFSTLRRDKKFRQLFDKSPIDLNVTDPYILTGLTHFFTTSAEMELWLTNLRYAVLHSITQSESTDALPLSISIAQHCFLNEYAFTISKEEEEVIQSLHETLKEDSSPEKLAAFSMYRPLHTLSALKELSKRKDTDSLSELIKQQIVDPITEENYRKKIPSFGAIKEETSQNVRNMYEENPYPRWHNTNAVSNPISCSDASYLIAGCGTGRSACQTATFLPDTQITAIDLSLTSLSYAKRKSIDLGLTNIEFLQGDILGLSEINKKFDVIECSGVLHHMQSPVEGWRALISSLGDGGVMNIGLYSRKARTHIINAQNYAKDKGYTDTPTDIRRFREDILSQPKDHLLRPLLNHHDFYTISNCRDLIFHVQEACYDLSDIVEILEGLNLVCIGLRPASPAIATLYRSRFPQDPQMCNLQNWEELEKQHPQICVGMYQFTCARKDEKAALNDQIKLLQRNRFF